MINFIAKKQEKKAYRTAMRCELLKLDRLFYPHPDDKPSPSSLNDYMKARVNEIRSINIFRKQLPLEAQKLSDEQIEDMRKYRQTQLASSVENAYEAVHMLDSGAFDYKRATDILIQRACSREINGVNNHLNMMITNLRSIMSSKENPNNAQKVVKIEITAEQENILRNRIKYIERLRDKNNGSPTNNS